MEKIILVVGIIAFALFLTQFILALFGLNFDTDIDIDFDGEADFSFSDLVSFKGILHFILGVTTYLNAHIYTGHSLTFGAWILAAIVGIIFVIGLYYIYKLCMSLQHLPKREEGKLENRYVTIIRKENESTYVGSATISGAFDLFTVKSDTKLTIGEKYKISSFTSNTIYV